MKAKEFFDACLSSPLLSCLTCSKGFCKWNEYFCRNCLLDLESQWHSRLGPFEKLGGLPLYSAGKYEGVWAKWIKLLKVQPKDYLPRPFDEFLSELSDYWAGELRDTKANCVISLPSHPFRIYFETELSSHLAEKLAERLDIAFYPDVLRYPKRHKFLWASPSKAGNKQQRVERLLKSPFRCAWPHEKMRNLKVLLVDDICTTGASLESCRKALESVGAQVVGYFVLARVPSIRGAK